MASSLLFDLENPLTSADEEQHPFSDSIAALFAAESDHMSPIAGGHLDLSARRDAVSLILQAQFSCNLDPSVAYLAINYVDRFLSKRQIPSDKPWVVRLLSISCLSIASKMKKTDLFLTDFQREEGFIFDAKTIRRMELLVLGALDWRMRSITPFSFLPFFLSFFSPAQPPLLHALKARASRILFKAQNEIKMLEFKPSVIAAAALLSAAHELFPIQFASFRSAMSSCEFEKLGECCNAVGDVAMDGCDSTFEMVSSSNTPVTVLGRHCSSSESERTVGSSSDDHDLKKRRISELRGALRLS
ncbi:cyclin-D6-1 isoform X2 [Phoenix dactylifera]|uniref:Cyclin-D6-1 isoform X2 n=1 Tax=Phoenix dactylifera TaxID=42345 RepID=A0A8B8ZIC8_PHODC|nr:cyclin-D6-1 isoform X2 [Phoenix dactylifera]